MITHMLVRGIEDLKVQKKILTLVAEKVEQTLSQLVSHIKATSQRSQGQMGTGQLSCLGTHPKGRKGRGTGGNKSQQPSNGSPGNCKGYGKSMTTHREGRCFPANLDCNNCGKKGQIGRTCPSPRKQKKAGGAHLVAAKEKEEEQELGEVALLSPTASLSKEGGFFFAGEANGVGLGHNIYTGGAWKQQKLLPHPTLEAYGQLSIVPVFGGPG
jgi:hypothetical protein